MLISLVVTAVLFFGLGLYARALFSPASSPVQGVATTSQVLRSVVLDSTSGIAVVDRYQDVVLFNPRAEELGLVRYRTIDDRIWELARRVLATGEPAQTELHAPDGPRRTSLAVRVTIRPLNHRADNQLVVLSADDDTEQVRMEATRRDFVANVSHELKTPVGAMALLAEALLESADDPESVQYFGTKLHNEALRLGRMVTELIALSRLQGAEKLPQLAEVGIDRAVDEALARARTSAEAAGITVETDEASGITVLADRELLVTALTNLIQNAIAYSPQDSPVSVSRKLNADGTEVQIAVTDRGIGIAPADQQRVFERFFRVDKARSRATGGTGLGLAIVKHVAANHNGRIDLWSRPGTGSTFTLVLPNPQPPAPIATESTPPAPGAPEPSPTAAEPAEMTPEEIR